MNRTMFAVLASVMLLSVVCGAAHAGLRTGWYDLGNGYSMVVMTGSDARAYGNLLVQPSPAVQKLNAVAQILCKYAPGGFAWSVARQVVYQMFWPVKWRIDWCAARAPKVIIYHRWDIPFWADREW